MNTSQNHPYITERKLRCGVVVFDAYAMSLRSRIFLRRYSSREEGMEAYELYIKTGVKPERKVTRLGWTERKAFYKKDTRGNQDNPRWYVTGRQGSGPASKIVHVGKFATEEIARAHGAIFEATGQRFLRNPSSVPLEYSKRKQKAVIKAVKPSRTIDNESRIELWKAALRRIQ